MDYSIEQITAIHNPQYTYYKLVINGKCQFDDFEEEVLSNPQYRKQYLHIITMMENLSDQHMFTEKKFRRLKVPNRNDLFEFKSHDLRIYVIKQNPKTYIVRGGYKKNQDADIKILKKTDILL